MPGARFAPQLIYPAARRNATVQVMAAAYLIDGYNLLYAMGVLHGRVGPGGLEKARVALLGLLHGALAAEAASVTVVFDARHPPRGVEPVQHVNGIKVVFATQAGEADDVIEDMLRHAGAPRSLTVVSDDHRLQSAAQRRQAQVLGCGDFLDLLQRRRRARPRAAAPAEPRQNPSDAETAAWLKEFGDLQNDPQFQDLFENYGLDDDLTVRE